MTDGGLRLSRTYFSYSTKTWRFSYHDGLKPHLNGFTIPSSPFPEGVVDACTIAYQLSVNGTLQDTLSVGYVDEIHLQRADGQDLTFTGAAPTSGVSGHCYAPNSTVTFTRRDQDISSALTASTDSTGQITAYQHTLGNGDIEHYDATGLLLSVELRRGGQVTLAYDSTGLITVTDPFGRHLDFVNTAGRVTSVTAPGGQQYAYEYDTSGNLTKVTYPDTTFKTYVYTGTLFTGVIDEKNIRYSTITYDAQGYPTNTVLAGGVDNTTFDYTNPQQVKITEASGREWTYEYAPLQRTPRFKGMTSTATTGNPSVAQVVGHDANGNINSRTDYNGNVTTYVYDLTRNLETSRTEAVGTPEARTITTTWHPTLRLPATITEPGRVTSYTYDAAGNRLTKTVTAGSLSQTWTWTYDSLGRVLTEDGPRTDVSDVTTYVYYDSTSPYYGNLQRLTNAAGQITEFTSYNANGQVLTQVDPNNVTTTFTYDVRGHLKTRTSNGKTTSYDYDPVGQLTKVTLPDGNWVEYVYDDAHRQIEIHDKAGNKIKYTLDAMSRRTQEEILDTQGGLGSLLDWIRNSLAANTFPQAQ